MLIKPLNDVRTMMHVIRTHGVREVPRIIAETMEGRLNRRFDRIHGVDTGAYVALSRLGFGVEEQRLCRDYRATPVRTLRVLLSQLPREVISSSTFVDFGSGKGRALLIAADFPFRRVLGVEFSEALHRIAEHNLQVYRGRPQRCFTLSSIHARAEEFAMPDGNLVLYFYNPFEEEILARVLSNTMRAWRQRPRTIYLLFFHMHCRALVQGLKIFHEVRLRRLPFDLARPRGYDAALFVTDTRICECPSAQH
jgi:SAM-dependent methyltransferase